MTNPGANSGDNFLPYPVRESIIGDLLRYPLIGGVALCLKIPGSGVIGSEMGRDFVTVPVVDEIQKGIETFPKATLSP